MAKKEELDLAGWVEEVAAQIDDERNKERKAKIRHVFNQLTIFDSQLRKNDNERKKLEEKRKKAADKLAQISAGNVSILDSIDLNNKNNDE